MDNMEDNINKKREKLIGICKVHWKEIFALSFVLHFAFDWFIFLAGYIIGKFY